MEGRFSRLLLFVGRPAGQILSLGRPAVQAVSTGTDVASSVVTDAIGNQGPADFYCREEIQGHSRQIRNSSAGPIEPRHRIGKR